MKTPVPRNPFGVVIGFSIASAALAVGIAASVVAVSGLHDVEAARRVFHQIAGYTPPGLAVWLHDAANDFSYDVLTFYLVGGGMLMLIGHFALDIFRRDLRPVEVSDDGLARIHVANAPARPGRAFEGTIEMRREPGPAEAFKLRLFCMRTSADNDRFDSIFDQTVEAKPAAGARGAAIPFRFDVPDVAPSSGPSIWGTKPRYQWSLSVEPAKGMFATTSTFDVRFEPALAAAGLVAASPPPTFGAETFAALVAPRQRPRDMLEGRSSRIALGCMGIFTAFVVVSW